MKKDILATSIVLLSIFGVGIFSGWILIPNTKTVFEFCNTDINKMVVPCIQDYFLLCTSPDDKTTFIGNSSECPPAAVKEVSILTEQKLCKEKGGSLDVNRGSKPFGATKENPYGITTITSGWVLTCTKPYVKDNITGTETIFNYTINEN